MIFRIRYNILEGYVYYYIHYGESIEALGFTGANKNMMKLEAFRSFRGTLECGADNFDATGNVIVQFIPDQTIRA